MSNETILVKREEGVVNVTLNRPERKNAVNSVMWHELQDLFREVANDRSDRVVVITGAGGEFCSGADVMDRGGLTGRPEDPPLVGMQFVGEVILALHELPKPTIAKVRGIAAGAGLSLALSCDLMLVAEGARFSEIFAKRGLSLDAGSSWLLPRRLGLHKAKELAYFADIVSAEEAASIGLVNRVVPESQLDEVVDDWARRLAAGPPIALSMTKKLLNNSYNVTMAQALEDEARCQTVNFATKDTMEAMTAFAEKRPPKFTGR